MPSLPIGLMLLHLVPSLVIFHGGSSHRLKHLEKSDRREAVKAFYCLLLFLRVASLNTSFKCLIQLMDIHSPVNAVHNFISNLESTFSESLCIEDAQKPEHASERDGDCNLGEVDLCGGFEQQEIKLNMKCLKEHSTFPYPDMMFPPSSTDEDGDTSFTELLSDQSPPQSNYCSGSLPAPPKLSAMKGSREKQGGSQMKLTVKWAPDVYDPVPTLLSHIVKGKKQQKSRHKSEKKNGKKGKKSYSSKGSSGKDKKHYRKLGGTSDLCYKWWLSSHDKVIEASTELDDLDVVSHDSHCGTSFLKQSVAEVHYTVGEAQ